MSDQSAAANGPRFVRRTSLAPHEYRKNFHQVDGEVIAAVTSPEADRITPLMSKIYLRLVSAPTECWEGPGTLYFTSKTTEGKQLKASKVLYEVLGVASATAHKALSWMHEQGIIGYSSGKNGVGIRIFLNRAATSIGLRDDRAGKKILPFARGSNGEGRGSLVEPAFKDSFAVQRDYSDTDLNPHAPKNGADTKRVAQTTSDPGIPTPTFGASPSSLTPRHERREIGTAAAAASQSATLEEIVARLRSELEPCVNEAAARAAAREIAETRRWLEERALPKAVRVAQRETYDLLRKLGALDGRGKRARAGLGIGIAAADSVTPAVRPLTPAEITETAETCVALYETQGKGIDETLHEISAEQGGWVYPADALKVRDAAHALLARAPGGEVSTTSGG